MQMVTVMWQDRLERQLLVEDHVEDPDGEWWSASDYGGENFYRIDPDGTVGDDAGNGDWYGTVTDWQGLKEKAVRNYIFETTETIKRSYNVFAENEEAAREKFARGEWDGGPLDHDCDLDEITRVREGN